jgi:hypothetical protein
MVDFMVTPLELELIQAEISWAGLGTYPPWAKIGRAGLGIKIKRLLRGNAEYDLVNVVPLFTKPQAY